MSTRHIARLNWIVLIGLWFLGMNSAAIVPINAQETYQLLAPSVNVGSAAERTDQELIIRDPNGGASRYARDPRMDSGDGMWIGYTSRAARQVIRWPITNQGHMQIGTFDGTGQVRYRESKMEIIADRQKRFDPVLPNEVARNRDANGQLIRDEELQKMVSLRLANRADHLQFLSFQPDGQLTILGQNAGQGLDWTMVPVGNGMVRFQAQHANRLIALRCDPRNRRLGIGPLVNDASQLWRWHQCPNTLGGYALESVLFPGQALAFQAGQLMLQPLGFGGAQQWFPVYQNLLPVDPTFRSVSNRIVPNPQLPPAQIDFLNTHSEAIFVLLADKRSSGQIETIRIPAGQSHRVSLDRDAGANLVETHEVITGSGLWDRQEFSYAIPPAILYDVSVYEEILQSIAIDRTGKSPNPIEDVNYQPKSLGWFVIPPGDALPDRGSIDLHAQAKEARNPGAVRKIDRELLEKKKLPSEDPLRSLLREFQGQRAAF